jgi:hypothetical protein
MLECVWNLMAQGDAREGKWRGNWRMEWLASTLHTTSEHGVSSITNADAHTSAASSRLNWRPRRFKWTRPFRRKTKSGFCACAITFQTQSTKYAASEGRIQPMPAAVRFKAADLYRLNDGMAVSNAAEGMECSSLALPVCCAASGLCGELIIHSDGPYRARASACVRVRARASNCAWSRKLQNEAA